MKLSIVIVAFNAVQSLKASLPTALSLRSRHQIEVVVVDDGSTDGTADYIADISRNFPTVRYERCPENLGRAAARNIGLEIARGEYLCFLDSDDYLLASAMDGIEEAILEAPDIIVPQRLDFDPKTNTRYGSSAVDTVYSGVTRIRNCSQYPAIFRDNFITGKLLRSKFLTENEIRFEDRRRNAEDILFSTDIFLNARLVRIVSEHFYVYARGGYKGKFSLAKCADVLSNTNKIARYAQAGPSGLQREVLSSKVATILFETFGRAEGVLKPAQTIEAYRETVDRDALSGLGRPRFASPKAQSVLKALQSGHVEQAYDAAK